LPSTAIAAISQLALDRPVEPRKTRRRRPRARSGHTNPDLDTTIVGTINPEHLQTNLDILQKGPLPPDLYEEAKDRLAVAGSAPRAGAE
jgi:hypothetical protein